MSDTTPRTELKSRYADRIQDDIAHNESELKRISEEISSLQAELGTLEENRTLLESMLKSLGSGGVLPPLPAPAAEKTAGKAAGKVPRQKARDTTAAKPAQAKKTRETPAAPAKAAKSAKPAKAAAATKPAAPAAEKTEPQGSTLVELIVSQLGSETSPRSAAEITSTLQKTHPKREFSTKVVRNTLEALVAKARAERTRQQRSVFYVALPGTGTPAKAAADTKTGADKAVDSKAGAKDGAA
ncbi:hypothetical protein [Streptomyces endophyticus]|uniref:Regulatory protein n=1 Tax=Streptomyces endophyticus TaxID=714166 RepID=A0ABU6F4W2_9ACTN|nr:hypothetical protein [Streptomyces endophyticus]MEB8339039.1 hypothetical protein [Streptomyces endophyticus]